MRIAAAALAVVTLAGVAGRAAAGDDQAPPTLRVPEDARVAIVGARFAPGFPRSTPVEAAGDVNGDGRPDLLVRNRQGHAGDQTHSYLIFGGRLPARLSLDRVGRSGLALLKSADGDWVGAVGDVDGDRRADLVRCPLARARAEILLGGARVGARRGDTIVGASCGDAPGDVDGDGLADLLLYRYRPAGGEVVAVVYGSRGPRRTIEATRLGGRGFQISAGQYASVSPLGDVNGDGRADLAAGRVSRSLQVELVFGRRRTGTLDVGRATLPLVTGSRVTAVERAGDVNGDGIGDLAIVEIGGRVCVVFGRRGAWPKRSGCTATRGLVIRGVDERHATGSVEPAGDLDGDGYGELLVFVHRSEARTTAPGAVYLVHGRREPGRVLLPTDPRTIEITAHRDLGEGWAGDWASPGDVTADGRPDIVIGSGWSGDAWILSPAPA